MTDPEDWGKQTRAGAGEKLAFIRVGKLDAGAPALPEYHESRQYWPAASLDRRRVLLD